MILAFSISDLIRIPFGYVLDILYQLTTNYGVALILFSLMIKLILLPASAKSKRSMMAMSRLAPLVQTIQAKYPNDQVKANNEIQKLYKDEGVSLYGGCLWSILPLLLLFPLYNVIREPITYMLHFSREEAAAIVAAMKELAPHAFASTVHFDQLAAMVHLTEYAPKIVEALPELAGRIPQEPSSFLGLDLVGRQLQSLNFTFLGIDLAQIPNWKFWTWTGISWNTIGGVLIPVLSAGTSVLSMVVSQKLNAKVATDDNGEVDEEAARKNAANGKFMMYMMPVMSLVFGFMYPCALSVYWLAQGLFGIAQDALLTVRYRKIYDDEDEIKRRVAAERAAIEAEKERIRAQRRAENPDGITTNTSKKKLQNRQQVEREQSRAAANRTAKPIDEDAPLSGDPERPFAKGHAYRADRYSRGPEIEE